MKRRQPVKIGKNVADRFGGNANTGQDVFFENLKWGMDFG
jgi:hypothetical protein